MYIMKWFTMDICLHVNISFRFHSCTGFWSRAIAIQNIHHQVSSDIYIHMSNKYMHSFRLYNLEIHTVEKEQNYRSSFGCIFKPWVNIGWMKHIYIYIYIHTYIYISFLYVDNHLPLIYIYHHHQT